MSEKDQKHQIGQAGKDFSLKDQKGEDINLSRFEGKKVLLSFHPLAWTPICADQMLSLEANKDQLDALNTVALGVSIDSNFSKAAWAKELGVEETSFLADFWPYGEVAKQYGIFREANGFSERANIILDENRKIIFFKVYPVKELPDIDEILDFLKKSSQEG
jgi:peroxiredoxin